MGVAVILSALAILLLAGAVLLWSMSALQSRRQAAVRVLTGRLAQTAAKAATESSPSLLALGKARPWRSGLAVWDRLLLRAGIVASVGFYLGRLLPMIAIPVILLLWIGPASAVASFVIIAGLMLFMLWLRAERRQRRMVAQLPGFLDAMVRLLSIGNSLSAAFHGALDSAVSPLDEVIGRADSLVRTGQDLDVALRHVAKQYGLHELELIAAVIAVALRFGGRSDLVLERMAAFIRDLEQARAELHAMSAEIRISAWILGLMPIGIAAFIVLVNNRIFMGMWHDPVGSKLLIGAAVLQIVGSYGLYRMAKSI